MRTIFTDEAPVPEIKGGLVTLTFKGDAHPTVATPRKVIRQFCSDVLFLLDEDERKPDNVRPFRKGGEH